MKVKSPETSKNENSTTKERMQPSPIRTANITLLAGNDLREKRKKVCAP